MGSTTEEDKKHDIPINVYDFSRILNEAKPLILKLRENDVNILNYHNLEVNKKSKIERIIRGIYIRNRES